MKNSTVTQVLLGIAEAQYKLDASGPNMKRVADAFKRRRTIPRLQQLGFESTSDAYLDAYTAVKDADEAEKQYTANTSPLAILAKAKMAIIQGGH